MIGQFEYKGIHSSKYNVYYKTIQKPLLPPTKTRMLSINTISGSYDFGDNEYENIPITIKIGYIPENFIERKQRAREISNWLSSKTWEKLIFADEPDKYYLARVNGKVDLDPDTSSGEAEITFICQPFVYMSVDTGSDTTWEEADFPWIIDIPWNMIESYKFTATEVTHFNFEHPGTKEIDISNPQGSKSLIKVNGSWTTLTISLNGNTLQYTEPGLGELIIDNVEMEVALDGVNKFSVLDGDIDSFLTIIPGENTMQVDGTDLNITVTIDFAPIWL